MQTPATASDLAWPNHDGTVVPRSLGAGESMLPDEIRAFLVDRVARGLSGRTVDWYREKLSAFASFAAQAGIASIFDLTPRQARSYLLVLARAHNPGGVHAFYRALRAFVNWWAEEQEPAGWCNPLRKVRAPKVPQTPLTPVPLADISAMLEVCPADTVLGCRDRAILLALLDSGCRASEFVALCVGDLDPATGACQVRGGKGAKSRVVFLGERAREAVGVYLGWRDDLDLLAPLWATRAGSRLSHAGLREVLRRRARHAGTPTPSIHSFRRAFALGCLRRGMDVFSLQRLMGHADIGILRVYLAQTHDDLLVAHQRHGPVDGLLGRVSKAGGKHGAG
jgi:site-specific recombinase XerD